MTQIYTQFLEITSRNRFRFFVMSLPVLLGAFYIYIFGVNVPRGDEFDFLPSMLGGELPPFKWLISQHNEHRVFFPRIVYYYILTATKANAVAVMYASFGMLVCLYYVVLRYIFCNFSGFSSVYAGLLVGVALFHPAQWENILWAFQIGFYMSLVFSGFSFFFFSRSWSLSNDSILRLNRPFFLALACAAITSFSSSQGLLTWLIIAGVWLVIGKGKTLKTPGFYLWCGIGVLVWVAYFHGYNKPRLHPNPLLFLEHPLNFVKYNLAYLGGSFGGPQGVLFKGGVLLALGLFFVFHFMRHIELEAMYPIMLICYGALVGVAISVGRLGFGWELATIPRYCTFSLAFVWGGALYATWLLQQKCKSATPLFRLAAVTMLVFSGLLLLASLPDTLRKSAENSAHMQLNKYYLQEMETTPDPLFRRLFHNLKTARRVGSLLATKKYSAFADKPPPFEQKRKGILQSNIDFYAISKMVVRDKDAPYLHIWGWAFDPSSGMEPQAVYLKIGTKRYRLYSETGKGDVTVFLFRNRIRPSEFVGNILIQLPAGVYPLRLEIVSHDGLSYYSVGDGYRCAFENGMWQIEREL